MQTIREHFVELKPRPDRRRARNHRTDLERTLLAQDAGRPHPLSRRPRATFTSTTCSRKRSSRRPRPSANAWARTTGASACFEDNAGIVAFDDEESVCIKVETHNHPSALEPYGGANTGLGGVIRDPLGTGLGAKPVCNTDVFCFAPPDTPVRQSPAGRAASQGRRQGGGRRSSRLRQPHGHSHRQRRRLFRRALSRQPAGVLRQRGDDSRRQVREADAPGRLDRRRRRPHRTRRHSRRHVFVRRADQRERNALRRRGADRQRHHRKDAVGRRARGPRPRAVHGHHRLRRRGLLQRRRRNGRRDRGGSLARPRPAQIRGAVVHRNLDLRSAGADGARRAAEQVGTRSTLCARRKGSKPPSSASSPTRSGWCSSTTDMQVADLSMAFSARRPAAGRARSRLSHLPLRSPLSLRRRREPVRRRASNKSSARSTCAARNGSSGSTITKCRPAASSSRWSAWRGRPLRRGRRPPRS